MKKVFALCATLICAALSLFIFSCKGKGNSKSTAAGVAEIQAAKEESIKTENEIKQISYPMEKPMPILTGMSKFYIGGRLADTMYVDSSNGLSIRMAGNSSAEKIGRLPNAFPVKVVALGNKENIDGIDSFWVQIVLPDYEDEKTTIEFGWVYGEYLSKEIPKATVPQSAKELADYISQMPVLFYNSWWSDSMFYNGQHSFYFYQDGTFDYYVKMSEGDIEKKASGKWEADSEKYISIQADGLALSGFNVFNTRDDFFDVSDTDNANGKFLTTGERKLSFGFTNEKILKNYKYAARMNNDLKDPAKETSVSINEEAYGDYIKELLVTGVDLTGTQYEEQYHDYWNSIREKIKVLPVHLDNAIEFGFDLPYSIEGIGCYVTPYENNRFTVYSDSYTESTKTGTFEPGQIAIIKQSYTKMVPPIPFTWMKVMILDNGIEGWIYTHNDDPEILTTYKKDIKNNFSYETSTMNASITTKTTNMKLPREIKKIAVSPSGKYILLHDDISTSLYQKDEKEPIIDSNIISNIRTFTFSPDESKIYFVQKNGSILVTDLLMKSQEDLYEINAESGCYYSHTRQIAVSNDQRYIFMEVMKDGYSREVPRIVCYDTEKRKCQEYDIRTIHDYNNGYNYYSKININKNNEVLILASDGDNALVKFTPQNNGELLMSQLNFEHSRLEHPGFTVGNKGYTFLSRDKKYFVRISNEGNEIRNSIKFLPESGLNFDHDIADVIYNSDYSIAAVLSGDFRGGTQYLTFYSTATFNPLYTIEFNDLNHSSYYSWTENGFFIYNSDDGKTEFHNIRIKEKKNQISVSPEATPRLLEICNNRSPLYLEGVHGMTITLSPYGHYLVTSYIHDYDDSTLGYMSGSYRLEDQNKVILNQAFAFGPDEETYMYRDDSAIYHGFSPAHKKTAKLEITGTDSFGNLNISTFEFAK